MVNGQPMELWEGARFIVQFPRSEGQDKAGL
jgi:hypothetical protein